jgi:hypothetical protein
MKILWSFGMLIVGVVIVGLMALSDLFCDPPIERKVNDSNS